MPDRHFTYANVREMTPAERANQARLVRQSALGTKRDAGNPWEPESFQRHAHRGNC